MKTLLLLRHAKAEQNDELPDVERSLTGRGKRDAKEIGRRLAKEQLVPDLILSSSAVRARKTAKRVAKRSGYDGPVELQERLYLASKSGYLAALQELDDKHNRVLAVGHNPGISDFLNALTGTEDSLPTAALAIIELPLKTWHKLTESTRGKLVGVWTPE